jgi:hypothetical protein
MSAGELLFDPASEYEVIEEFEFDELVQRPSEIRFFTLQEQAADLIEKLLPTTGRVAKGVIRKAEYEVDTFVNLHNKLVVETTDGFVQKEYTKPVALPWVSYKNTHTVESATYNWNQKWTPLYDTAAGMTPNYYMLMLDSLPKSGRYFSQGDGIPVYVDGRTKIENIRLLDRVPYTKTGFNSDGTFKVLHLLREDTQDIARFTGYIVNRVPLPLPNPLDNHPFLSMHDGKVLNTTEPLPELLPNMQTIFDHAIPETSNPYKVAMPYLKLFNITLKDVPFKLWKSKFPPVPVVEEVPQPAMLTFPQGSEDAPSKTLLDAYKHPWYLGLSSRKWLFEQIDGGALISKMLLSKAGDVGIVAIPPPVVLPDGNVINGTPEDCLPTEITDFDDFSLRGIYRPPKCSVCGAIGHGGPSCPDKKSSILYKPVHGCIPLSFIVGERQDALYHEKSAWTPGTGEAFLREYQTLLQKFSPYDYIAFAKAPAATPATARNETRKLIVSILDDDMKLPEDQLTDITDLIQHANHENNVYTDPESGAFLVCDHELARLRGEYAKDPKQYLATWCNRTAGFYVCKYSGERVAEIIEHQDEFDEQGRVINRHDAGNTSTGHAPSFASEIRDLHTVFKATPAEDIMYLLITLLQVLPQEADLSTILAYVRSQAELIRSKPGDNNKKNFLMSVFGFCGIVILLQTHRPQLIPRRSFGPKPILLHGFPRDTTDTNDAPLVDSLLGALQKTFETYHTSFNGPSVEFIRTLLDSRKKVKSAVIATLQKAVAPKFKEELMIAKGNLVSAAVGPAQTQSYAPPILTAKKDLTFLPPTGSVRTAEESRFRCRETVIPWLTSISQFSFVQPELPILQKLYPSQKATLVDIPIVTNTPYTPTAAEIRKRLELPMPTIPLIKKMLDYEKPRILQAFLLRLFSIATSELTKYVADIRSNVERAYANDSLLRDYYKGILREFAGRITSVDFQRSLQADTAIKSLMSNAVETRSVMDNLAAKEREMFKLRLRRMPDIQRDITKKLIDLGLAPYLITKADRDAFVSQIQTETAVLEPPEAVEAPENVPEEGLHAERDVGPQGEEYTNEQGDPFLTDYGDYGDMRDGQETGDAAAYNDEEDFGI